MSEPRYIEYSFSVSPLKPATDILIAQLGEIKFESFVETEDGVLAYIKMKDLDIERLNEVHILHSDICTIKYSSKEIETVNWNAEWEKNFNPITVSERCYVRAPFHNKLDFEYDIVIEPKMSFGTGHHETTHMMIEHLLNIDMEGMTVLDMGCGTAVLAILAEMRGAKSVDAIDIDNWCYLNSVENAERNNCKNIAVFEGDANIISDKGYDLIIANINRNILLNDIKKYSHALNGDGILLLSGFYKEDIEQIENECKSYMLKLSETLERNNWVSLKFIN